MSDGPDLVTDTHANDVIDLGAGDDLFGEVNGGDDVVYGGTGYDRLSFSLYPYGGTGGLTLTPTPSPDGGYSGTASWDNGENVLNFYNFDYFVVYNTPGGDLDDNITTGDGGDIVGLSTGGDDILNMGAGIDTLRYFSGNMTITSSDANGYNGTFIQEITNSSLTFTGVDVFVVSV